MELQQLRYVLAVARTGNFSRAAEQCHVSQPSLSQQIHKLEAELGEKLFDRLRQRAQLTPVGETFVRRAARILEEVESAGREAREARELTCGTLCVGALPTIAPYLLPTVVSQFATQFPGVQLVVQEDTTARMLGLLAAGEVDFAIVSLPITDARFAMESLFEEDLLLALPARHRLARRKAITLADLADERFILMKEGHCLGDQVLDFCHRQDFRPTVICRSAQIATIQSLVGAGLGISLVPRMACASGPVQQPIYRPLADARPRRAVVALWLRQRPPGRAAQAFLKCLRPTGPGEKSFAGVEKSCSARSSADAHAKQ